MRRKQPAGARSRWDGKRAPDDSGADWPALFPKTFHVQRERILRVCYGLLERIALCMQAGKIRGVNVVSAFVLRLEDELDLQRLRHGLSLRVLLAPERSLDHSVLLFRNLRR